MSSLGKKVYTRNARSIRAGSRECVLQGRSSRAHLHGTHVTRYTYRCVYRYTACAMRAARGRASGRGHAQPNTMTRTPRRGPRTRTTQRRMETTAIETRTKRCRRVEKITRKNETRKKMKRKKWNDALNRATSDLASFFIPPLSCRSAAVARVSFLKNPTVLHRASATTGTQQSHRSGECLCRLVRSRCPSFEKMIV